MQRLWRTLVTFVYTVFALMILGLILHAITNKDDVTQPSLLADSATTVDLVDENTDEDQELINSGSEHIVNNGDLTVRDAREPRQKLLIVKLPTPSRVWTSTDGREFLGRITEWNPEDQTISLRRADGETFDGVPIDRFSKEDQEFLFGEKKQ